MLPLNFIRRACFLYFSNNHWTALQGVGKHSGTGSPPSLNEGSKAVPTETSINSKASIDSFIARSPWCGSAG